MIRDHHEGYIGWDAFERNQRLMLDEAAEMLTVSPATIRRLIGEGVLPANQSCKGAPWVIQTADLRRAEVVGAARRVDVHRPANRSIPPEAGDGG